MYKRQVQEGLSFGAATRREVEMAQLICRLVPGMEMVRMVNSGTEAVMSALRLARGYTGREKLIKFAGCYHGHSDSMLVKAGSGALTNGKPDSAGVTRGAAQDLSLIHIYTGFFLFFFSFLLFVLSATPPGRGWVIHTKKDPDGCPGPFFAFL